MITAEVSNREVGVVLHDHPNLMKGNRDQGHAHNMLALTDDIRAIMGKNNVANIVLISTTIPKGGDLLSYSAV